MRLLFLGPLSLKTMILRLPSKIWTRYKEALCQGLSRALQQEVEDKALHLATRPHPSMT